MASFSVKKGDYAMIIAGKDKGKPCMVIAIDTAKKRALIEGKNLETVIKKHVKARKASDRSGIIEQPGTVDISNLMPICANCGKPTRVRKREVDGKKERICVKCDAVLVTKRPTERKARATVRRKSAVAAEKAAAEKAAAEAAAEKAAAEKAAAEKAAAEKAATEASEAKKTVNVAKEEPKKTASVAKEEPKKTASVAKEEPKKTASVAKKEPKKTESVAKKEPKKVVVEAEASTEQEIAEEDKN